jgi:hypothetical protein
VRAPAVKHLKEAVAKDGTPRRKYHLGRTYSKLGEHVLAQRLTAEALKQDPKLFASERAWETQ